MGICIVIKDTCNIKCYTWLFLRYLMGWVSDSFLLMPRSLRAVRISFIVRPSPVTSPNISPALSFIVLLIKQSIILHFGVSVAFYVSQCPLLYISYSIS